VTDAELAHLTTTRANYAKNLAEVSAKKKPTYSLAGRSVSWVEYAKFLREEIVALDKQIAAAGGGDDPPYILTAVQ
jgi:hypothetical protein